MQPKQNSSQDHLNNIAKIQKLFMSEEGEEVLKILLERYHFISGIYSDNPHTVYFREGQRSVIMDILNFCEIDLFKLQKMIESEGEDF